MGRHRNPAQLGQEACRFIDLAKVPENAGPLNSQHLVHRSLTLMRDLSPEYLNRFMSYVDALSWLDQANAMGADVARAETKRKTARRRSG